MYILEPQIVENSTLKYTCKFCDYTASQNWIYVRHLQTPKHIKNSTEPSNVNLEISSSVDNKCIICDKTYKNRSGLWKHKKTCTIKKVVDINNETNTIIVPSTTDKNILTIIQSNSAFKNIILNIVKGTHETQIQNNVLQKQNNDLQQQNIDLQKQVLEVCKNIQPGVNNIINNTNNKTFNLNFFLNEQCKDAMNMTDFVNSFHLKMEDLESVGELGYVEGISKLLVNKLNGIDVYKRPIHCSDAKRETLYIKDQDKWEKEQNDNPKIRKAIKKISHRNTALLSEWRDTHPGSRVSTSEVNTQYMSLVRQSNGGNDDITDSEDKIIRRLAREVVIAK